MGTRAKVAQVGGGDDKVVAHPGYTKLPACQFTLESKAAQDRYGELARLIWNAGRLSLDMHMTLSQYVAVLDRIEMLRQDGKGLKIRASWFEQLERFQRKLAIDDLDKPIAAPVQAQVNPYTYFGFPSRRG